MAPVVGIIAPGNMGAAVGKRLVAHGVKVVTSLAGRSTTSAARAASAGIVSVDDLEVVQADFLLSIVPPKEAAALAERLAPALQQANRKAIYVECNAVSPETAQRIGTIIRAVGGDYVDGGIVGGPPQEGDPGPRFYVSGPAAARVATLNEYGLIVRIVDGPVGAASALKLSYAGLNKGVIGLGAAMVLAARRAGVEDVLMRELSESQRALLTQLSHGVPSMFSKADRWAPEMKEIAAYVGDRGEAEVYQGFAGLYERLAEDLNGSKEEIDALAEFFGKVQR